MRGIFYGRRLWKPVSFSFEPFAHVWTLGSVESRLFRSSRDARAVKIVGVSKQVGRRISFSGQRSPSSVDEAPDAVETLRSLPSERRRQQFVDEREKCGRFAFLRGCVGVDEVDEVHDVSVRFCVEYAAETVEICENQFVYGEQAVLFAGGGRKEAFERAKVLRFDVGGEYYLEGSDEILIGVVSENVAAEVGRRQGTRGVDSLPRHLETSLDDFPFSDSYPRSDFAQTRLAESSLAHSRVRTLPIDSLARHSAIKRPVAPAAREQLRWSDATNFAHELSFSRRGVFLCEKVANEGAELGRNRQRPFRTPSVTTRPSTFVVAPWHHRHRCHRCHFV